MLFYFEFLIENINFQSKSMIFLLQVKFLKMTIENFVVIKHLFSFDCNHRHLIDVCTLFYLDKY